jgi:hypothetical protein
MASGQDSREELERMAEEGQTDESKFRTKST